MFSGQQYNIIDAHRQQGIDTRPNSGIGSVLDGQYHAIIHIIDENTHYEIDDYQVSLLK